MNDFFDIADFGAIRDGIADDTIPFQQALNEAGSRINKGPQTVYYSGIPAISSPLIIPPLVTLQGNHAARTEIPEPKNKIKALSTFTGNAMLKMIDQVSGNYSIQSYGQSIKDVTLDGSAAKAKALFSGIRSEGLVRGIKLHNVSIFQVSDRGIQNSSLNSATGYSWHADNVQVGGAGVDGFRLSGLTDGTWINCRAIGCGRHGWYIDGCPNSLWSNCRSEWSKQHGWLITSNWGTGRGSGGALFSNCSTDRNNFDGFNVSVIGNSSLGFTNINARRDGRNNGLGGSGYSGFRINGSTMPISIDNLFVYPGVDDSGNGTVSPDYGFRAQNSTWVRVNSGYLHARVTPHQNMGGNTFYEVSSGVGKATGDTVSPVRS